MRVNAYEIIPHKIGQLARRIGRCLLGLARLALTGDGSVGCRGGGQRQLIQSDQVADGPYVAQVELLRSLLESRKRGSPGAR